jgi:hypothetical protein
MCLCSKVASILPRHTQMCREIEFSKMVWYFNKLLHILGVR